jgi:hypothetical protein
VALGPHVTPAPFFCLTRAAWIPYALAWNPETGEVRGVEGPRGFDTYRAAVEASRSLTLPDIDMTLTRS